MTTRPPPASARSASHRARSGSRARLPPILTTHVISASAENGHGDARCAQPRTIPARRGGADDIGEVDIAPLHVFGALVHEEASAPGADDRRMAWHADLVDDVP